MIVEALINLEEKTGELSFKAGDIITVQPAGHKWGKGDLKGRTVVKIDLPDLPCGDDFMVKKRCSECEHQGIQWASKTLSDGDIGIPKTTCPKEKYAQADMEFVYSLNEKGVPKISATLKQKRRGKVELSQIDTTKEVSETIKTESVLTEKTILSSEPVSKVITK